MNSSIRKKLARGKRKNQYRLRDIEWGDQPHPMFAASNIKYDLADKTRGLSCGGIGAIHALARQYQAGWTGADFAGRAGTASRKIGAGCALGTATA